MPPLDDEWLPEQHLARFIVEVVEGLDLRGMSGSYLGSDSASHHPSVLLSILAYGYATGVFSSRKPERATYDSVAYRFVKAATQKARFISSGQAGLGRATKGSIWLSTSEVSVRVLGC